jgi:hypothetical protein
VYSFREALLSALGFDALLVDDFYNLYYIFLVSSSTLLIVVGKFCVTN